MPKQKRSTEKSSKTGFISGRASFAKISAVEGIRLKPAMKKRAAEASSKDLSAEETRKSVGWAKAPFAPCPPHREFMSR